MKRKAIICDVCNKETAKSICIICEKDVCNNDYLIRKVVLFFPRPNIQLKPIPICRPCLKNLEKKRIYFKEESDKKIKEIIIKELREELILRELE